MLEYLLKVSFIVAVAFLFYKIFLQQESFFATNRIYFVVCLALAFATPFVKLPALVNHQGLISHTLTSSEEVIQQEVIYKAHSEVAEIKNQNEKTYPIEQVDINKPEFPGTANSTSSAPSAPSTSTFNYSWTFLLSIFYIFGVAIFTLNLSFQILYIFYKIKKSKDEINDGECIIVNTPHKQAPCSFFKYILIYPDDYDFETYEQIILHEKIHVKQGHSWDLLLAELAVIILWFNPFVWFYKREIEKNIEFQTDAILLEKKKVDKSQYQLNLLQIAVPEKALTITTNYNQSLLKQRIMMMNAKKSTLNRYWKYAFIAPWFLGSILMLNEPAASQDVSTSVAEATPALAPTPVPEPSSVPEPLSLPETSSVPKLPSLSAPTSPEPVSSANFQDDTDMTKGFFYSYSTEKEYCIDFKGSTNDRSWNMNSCFDKNAFQKQSDAVFIMQGETGTLTLKGALDQETSQGKYEFVKDDQFEKYLSDNNIKSNDYNYIFHLHLQRVNRKYIEFVRKTFNNIKANQILALAIHEVDPSYIESLAKSGFKNLHADQVIAAKIHGVNPASIKEMQALGFGELSMEKLVMLKIHDVNADYLQKLNRAGFNDLSIDEAVAAKIHDLTPEAIKELQALGFNNLSLRKLTELKIHDVDAQFIQELKNAGFDNISIDEALQAKIHDLNPTSLKEIKALGFGSLSLRKMIELKIHDVNADYIERLKSAGFKDLSIDQVIQAKIHAVEPSSINKLKSLGFNEITFEKLVEAQMHGVDAAFLNDLKQAGFSGFSLDKAIQAKIHNVDSNFIKEARSQGYNLKTLEEYIRVKMHGLAKNDSN